MYCIYLNMYCTKVDLWPPSLPKGVKCILSLCCRVGQEGVH